MIYYDFTSIQLQFNKCVFLLKTLTIDGEKLHGLGPLGHLAAKVITSFLFRGHLILYLTGIDGGEIVFSL